MNIQSPPFEAPHPSSWWAIVLRGLLAIAFGFIALIDPGATAGAIALVFAVYAVADGVASLVASARRGRAGARWSWFLLQGLVSLIAGILAFAFPGITLLALLVVIAVRAIVVGALDLGGAIVGKGIDSRWLWALSGVLSIALGVILLARPAVGGLAILWMIGAYAIVAGVMTFAFGLHVRGLEHHAHEEELHLGGHPAAT